MLLWLTGGDKNRKNFSYGRCYSHLRANNELPHNSYRQTCANSQLSHYSHTHGITLRVTFLQNEATAPSMTFCKKKIDFCTASVYEQPFRFGYTNLNRLKYYRSFKQVQPNENVSQVNFFFLCFIRTSNAQLMKTFR